MDVNEAETIEKKAAKWAEENEEQILKEIVFDRKYRISKMCILMAGSPGAGKTETVRQLELEKRFTVLEADEIREMNPCYKKTENGQEGNAHLLQKATSVGLDYCRKVCMEKGIAFVQDTTFQNSGSRNLVKKLLKEGWASIIFFIFQDPKYAWKFTQARELEEGRNIPKESFAESFTNILRNIEYVQKRYPQVSVFLAIKEGKEIKEFTFGKKPIRNMLEDYGVTIPSKSAILKSIESGDHNLI